MKSKLLTSIKTQIIKLLGLKVTAQECGHKTLLQGYVDEVADGKKQKSKFGLKVFDNGKPPYCIDCLERMATHCAVCGESIRVGEPITLYIPNFTPEGKHSTFEEGGKKLLVGCLRFNCESSGNRCGFWVPPGEVYRKPSPLEIAFMTGNGVVFDDLGDPEDQGRQFKV